jgi:hypothetical protein
VLSVLPVKIVTNKLIFGKYTGFSFFIFIWLSSQEKNQERLLRHERIHFWHQVELLFVLHWFLYASFYLYARLIMKHNHYVAYRYNPFELEAYTQDQNVTYLENRKAFAWLSYCKQFSSIDGKDFSQQIPKDGKISW